MQYTREDLKQIASQLIKFLGHTKETVSGFLTLYNTTTDDELLQQLNVIAENLRTDGFTSVATGATLDPSELPDESLEFIYGNTTVASSEESLFDGMEVPEVPAPIDAMLSDDPLSELDALAREFTTLDNAQDGLIPQAELPVDAPFELDDVKVTELAVEQPPVVPDRFGGAIATVTQVNVEAAVITMMNILSQGKVLLVSASDIESLDATPISNKSKELPEIVTETESPEVSTTAAPPVSKKKVAPKPKAKGEPPEIEEVRKNATTRISAMFKSGGKLATLEERQAFAEKKKIKLKKPDASAKSIAFSIKKWYVDSMVKRAETKFNNK